jgi:LPXTG-motif cell wall-anchored protein
MNVLKAEPAKGRPQVRRIARIAVSALFIFLVSSSHGADAQQAPANSSRCPQTQGAGTSGQYPPRRGGLQLSRSAGRPGTPVTARGCGFRPGSQVTLDFLSQPVRVATATAGADGGFDATFNVPSSASVGEHTVEATGVDPTGEPRVLSAGFRVIGEGGGDLPRTGSSSTAPLTAAGVGLVLLGAAAVYGARRRRAQRAQA